MAGCAGQVGYLLCFGAGRSWAECGVHSPSGEGGWVMVVPTLLCDSRGKGQKPGTARSALGQQRAGPIGEEMTSGRSPVSLPVVMGGA